MKAALLTAHNAPLKLADVEPCELRAGQVLVRILTAGICGKQLAEIAGTQDENAPVPRLLGHEAAVIVEEVGPGVTKLSKGDKAVAHWRKSLGMDSEFPRYIYEGKEITSGRITTFSEMAIISENRLTKVPHETPNELCALLGCALSTAIGVMENEAKLKMGESVLIVGCGGVGLNLIRVARIMRAGSITALDQAANKANSTIDCGADAFTDSTDYSSANRVCFGSMATWKGFDVIVDTTGSPDAIANTVPLLASGGRYICVGQPKTGAQIILYTAKHLFDGEGKSIKATQGGQFNPDQDIPRIVAMWRSGALKLDGIVTHRFPLAHINEALDVARSGQAGRIMLEIV